MPVTCIKTSTRPGVTIQDETNLAESRDNIILHEYFVNIYDPLLPVTCLCGGKATKQSHHFGATVSTASEWETVSAVISRLKSLFYISRIDCRIPLTHFDEVFKYRGLRAG